MSVRESCWMLVSAFLFALMALFAKLSTAYYGGGCKVFCVQAIIALP